MKKPSSLDRFKIKNSRRLRNSMTDAEARLWRHLWRIPVEGTHFRRQVPIGRYFADFACHAIGLVIELDGYHHAEGPEQAYDFERTRFMESQGYRVVRFWNHEVFQELDAVLDTLFAIVQEQEKIRAVSGTIHPTPDLSSDPPHQGEGE